MNAWTAVGVFVAVTIVAMAIWYKSSKKLSISALVVEDDGSLSITAPVPSGNLSKLNGKKIMVEVKSLGRLYGSLCSIKLLPIAAGPAGVLLQTSAGMYNGNGIYSPNASDYVLISSA